MRILIADDDATTRFMLQAVIVKWGFDASTACDGRETWEVMQRPDAPKLVLLDWMMPEMDGLEVLRHIRALQTDRPPYIIMLTARGEKEDIIVGLDAGANDYLSKPFDPGELRARIEVGRRMVELQDALVESREIMAHQATHDTLTGLLNRRAIIDRLKAELSHAGRRGDILAVGMCDIDHFKKVNDQYGHHAGDDALCGLAKILGEKLRAYDSVGRMGGEEFLVIAPIKTDMDCMAIFNRLCASAAESRMETRSGSLSITVSIGVTCADDKNTVDEILAAADAALYRAKNEGRNRVVRNGKCLNFPCPCAS